MSKIEEQFRVKFAEYSNKIYSDQAKIFLNAFWEEGLKGEAEAVWKFTQKFIELDAKKKKEGHDLDEFEAHKFLESLGETMTVVALRERLRTIDLDSNNRMSLVEYLIFRYKKTVKDFVTAPQGDNSKEINEAQQKVDAASQALELAQGKLEIAKAAQLELEKQLREQKEIQKKLEHQLEEEKQAEIKVEQQLKEMEKALAEQKRLEDDVRKAEDENKAALDELHKQEKEYNQKVDDLTAKSNDSSLSTVQKNKAANELQQLKGEDPLPLRKAKINQGATVRKCEKATKAVEEQTKKVEQQKNEVEEAKHKQIEKRKQVEAAKEDAVEKTKQVEAAKVDADQKKQEAEDAAVEAEKKFQEAMDFLEQAKKRPGNSHGTFWYMDRELTEKKKYLPKSKQ